MAVFNPLNWERHDPVILDLPQGESLEGSACQLINGKTLSSPRLPSVSIKGFGVSGKNPESPKRAILRRRLRLGTTRRESTRTRVRWSA